MKASPIKTAFIEVTKQAVTLMRAPVKTIIDKLTNWQLVAILAIGIAAWPRARGPTMAIVLRIVTDARDRLIKALSSLSLSVRVWVATMLLKMIGRARTSGGGNAPTAPDVPMTMAVQIVADGVTHMDPALADIWAEVLSTDADASELAVHQPEFIETLQAARDQAPSLAAMIIQTERDMLLECEHCKVVHSPEQLWCPMSMGMTALPPPAGNFGCDLSKHESWCTCPIKDWRNQIAALTREYTYLYSTQISHRIVREAAYMDAARSLVHTAIEKALLITFPIVAPPTLAGSSGTYTLFPPYPQQFSDSISSEFDMREAFQSEKRQCLACDLDTDAEIDVAAGRHPQSRHCQHCDEQYSCALHRGAFNCADGVPGCNCSQ